MLTALRMPPTGAALPEIPVYLIISVLVILHRCAACSMDKLGFHKENSCCI